MNTTLIRWGQHGLVATLAAVIAACGGGSSGDAAPAAALRLDSAAAVTQTIGPAGGSIGTTAADGTVYTLTVPPKALRSATAITLAPIAAITALPSGVTLAGGAHLGPEGHRFDVPLKLSIALAAVPASAPLPFTYDGDLQQRHLYPATVRGNTIEFELVHFSGYAALVGVLDGALGYFPPPSERGDQGLQELVEARILGLDAPAARDAAMRNALQGWLDEFIKPEVEALATLSTYELDAFMTGRVARLANELKTFAIALKFAVLEGSTADAFVGLQDAFQFEAALAARDAIDLSTAGCSTSPDQAVLLIAPDILAWQLLAKLTDAVAVDGSLERPAVLQALCVRPVYDPQDGVSLSADIQPGQTGLLTVRAGYSINAGPPRFDLPMLIATAGTTNVSPSVFHTFETGAGQTHAQQFQWHPATTEMRIDVGACFAEAALAEVCTPAAVVRGLALVEFTFDNDLEGWAPGGTNAIQRELDGEGVVRLDGSDGGTSDGQPNSWISRVIEIPAQATTLSFQTSAHNRVGADSALRVRLLKDGVSHTLLEWEVLTSQSVSETDLFYTFVDRSVSIAAFAGQTVTIYFEQGDNDDGIHEQRYLDNIRIE